MLFSLFLKGSQSLISNKTFFSYLISRLIDMPKYLYLACSVFLLNTYSAQDQKPGASCPFPQTYNVINVNNISSRYYSGGDMNFNWFNGQSNYEFPKGSGKTAAGAAALWIGGIDGTGQLKLAAMTYRQNGIDFWTGPLDTTNAAAVVNTCIDFDKAPSVSAGDINSFLFDYNNNLTGSPNYTLNANLSYWAANTPTVGNTTNQLAPYVDVNNNGTYDPVPGGDYPKIKGDQMMYFVTNDNGGIHTESQAVPIGIEVHHSIYAYGCATHDYPELKNVIFHHYKIYNRSAVTLTKTVVGMWSSSGIGDNNDDYAGSNAKMGYGYYYNGDNSDAIYGSILPATAIAVLKAPVADNNDHIDNNGNGVLDEPNEEMSVPNVFYYQKAMPTSSADPFPQKTDPVTGIHYYNYMTGFWKDGSPMTCGGDAYGGAFPTKQVFPEEMIPGSACNYSWTEKGLNNPPGQRSILVCTQPFMLKGKSSFEIEFAFITVVDSTKPNDNWAAVVKLKEEVAKVKTFYNLAVKPSCLINSIPKTSAGGDFLHVFPNPVTSDLTIKSSSVLKSYTLTDALGKVIFYQSNVNALSVNLDLSGIEKGLYFLKVETPREVRITKVMHL
jgi:hypothetical protein